MALGSTVAALRVTTAAIVLVASSLAGCSGGAALPTTPSTAGQTAGPAATTNSTLAAPPAPTPTTAAAITTTTALPTTLPPAAAWRPIPEGDVRILFIGNSHTTHHDIPGTVASLLETLGTHQPYVETLQAGFLRMALNRDDITAEIATGNWDVVILQGHEISMAHSTRYSQVEVVELARLVREAGSRPLFFSEWKRQGVEETEYIEGLYQELAAKSGAEIIPVGRSWDEYLASGSDRELWSEDGNHSSAVGAFLAAAAIAHYLVGPDAEFEAPAQQLELLEAAARAITAYLK